MRLVVVAVIFILLCTSSVLGMNFSVRILPESLTIRVNESALFTLEVSHDSKNTEYFEIYSPDVLWDLATDPLSDRISEVKPGERKITKVLLTPLYVEPGFYGVPITMRHSGGPELVKESVMIGVVPKTDERAQYRPAVHAEIKFPKNIDPRQTYKLSLVLTNQNRRQIEKLDIKLRSDLINKDMSISLGPLQEKTLDFDISFDPATPPQEDILKSSLFTQSEDRTVQFDLSPIRYRIVPFGGINQTTALTEEFLIRTNRLNFINNANTMRDRLIEQNVTYVESWFLDSDPDPVVKKVAGGYIYQWHVILEGGQEYQIEITQNYRSLSWLILVAALGCILYFFLRSPLIVKKTALVVERQEGGVSQLNVLLTIRNRSPRAVRSLTIKDKVPAIAQIAKDHLPGSLVPEKVLHYDSGETLIKWHLAHIEPREERIVSFTIRTKLHVLGTMQLPPAQVRYNFFGWERKVSSRVEKLYR